MGDDDGVTRLGGHMYERRFTDEECARYRRLLDAFDKRRAAKWKKTGRSGGSFLEDLRQFADPELLALRLEVMGPEYDFNNFWSCNLGDYINNRLAKMALRLLDEKAADTVASAAAGPPACLHDRWYWVDQECHLVTCRACAKRGMWREGAVIDWVGDQRPALAPEPGMWYRARNGGYVHALAQEQRAFVQARRYTADGPPLSIENVDGLYDQTTGAFGNDSEWECVARLTDVPEVVWRHALPAELRPNVKRKY